MTPAKPTPQESGSHADSASPTPGIAGVGEALGVLRGPRHQRGGPVAGASVGLIAAGAALGVAELIAAFFPSVQSPVLSVGNVVVDNVPNWAKDVAIRTFGENDKTALIIGTTIFLFLFAALIGVITTKRRIAAPIGAALFGLVGAASALTRVGAGPLAVVPSIVGGIVAWLVMDLLLWPPLAADKVSESTDRRRFLVGSSLVVAGAAAAGGLGRVLSGVFKVSTNRDDIALPAPADPAVTLPSGVDPDIEGLTPFITPVDKFYRVDTALEVPRVNGDDWELKVQGMVDEERSYSLADLLDRKLVERTITLVCVSNQVGGTYASTAKWLGVPLAEILDEAGVQDGADQLLSRSVDNFTAGTPIETIYDGRDALLVVGMNGEPLPIERGFPARLIVPGLYGFVSATKWLAELNLTTFAAEQAYWRKRDWGEKAPIKTFSRIDRPGGLGDKVEAGMVAVAGVAWDPHVGIDKVELKIDDGKWVQADLAPVPSADTWVQWSYGWKAVPGSHNIVVRATNADGETQTSDRVMPIPDGATGWQKIVVNVT